MRVEKLPAIIVDIETYYDKVIEPSLKGEDILDTENDDVVAVSPRGETMLAPVMFLFNTFEGRDKYIAKMEELGVEILSRDKAALCLFDRYMGKERPMFCGEQEDERWFMERVEQYRKHRES